MQNDSNSKFVKGFLFGATVSGVAVWWWNSDYGSKARENLEDMTADLLDDMQPKIKKIKRAGRKNWQKLLDVLTVLQQED